jgi:membrane protease YdiL (CAAX protease family)
MKAKGFRWGVFGVLLAGAVCGVASSFPFVFSLYADLLATSPVSLPVLILLSLLQNTVILALATGAGLFLTAKVGLPGARLIEDRLSGKSTGERFRAIIQPALMTGVGVGATLIVLFFLLLKNELPDLPFGKAALMPVWKRLLICLYGGLTEEVLLRLFLFSLLAWLLGKVWRSDAGATRGRVFWTANFILAVLFGLGHLGPVIPLMPVTLNIVVAALLLNGIASFAFTQLYWKRGLEASMLAHFVTDVMIYVIGPTFIAR